MMARTQITLDHEMQRQARQRAAEIGVSLAEYVRRLVARDLTRPGAKTDVTCVFDLGAAAGSDVAKRKHTMVAEAFQATRSAARR